MPKNDQDTEQHRQQQRAQQAQLGKYIYLLANTPPTTSTETAHAAANEE